MLGPHVTRRLSAVLSRAENTLHRPLTYAEQESRSIDIGWPNYLHLLGLLQIHLSAHRSIEPLPRPIGECWVPPLTD